MFITTAMTNPLNKCVLEPARGGAGMMLRCVIVGSVAGTVLRAFSSWQCSKHGTQGIL